MRATLTDVSVRALRAPARGQYTVWDKSSPVGVRVSSGGGKTYILLVGSGIRRTIGKVGIISLADARTEAKRILAEKILGLSHQPSKVRFDTALPDFIEQNYKSKSPRTKHEVNRLLRNHFLTVLGKKAIPEITDADVSRELDKLSHVPSEQLHAFRAIRVFLRWCTRPPRRYIRYSPLEGYEPPSQDRKGTRVLSDKELVNIWNACDGMFGSMVRLLILWGTRNGETGRLRRTWVDGQVLVIPGAVTKNRRDHAIPLLPMAKAILDAQPEIGPCFFPSPDDAHEHFKDGSWGKYKIELAKRSGVSGWQLRDLRRTFRTNMAKLKVSREVAETLVNHVTGQNKSDLDEIYNRYDYLDEKRDALAKWESRITSLLADNL